MSRRKRANTLEDSFDLFLDTITNTFGGVLLIAILIVLLIRENKESKPEDKKTGPTSALVSSQIKQLKAHRKNLQMGLELQLEFQQDFQTQEVENLANEIEKLINEELTLSKRLKALQSKTASIDEQLNAMKASNQTKTTQLENLTYQLGDLKKNLEKEKQARTRTMRLPKETATSKSEIAVIVDNNKLYFVESRDSRFGFEHNQEFMVETFSGADIQIGPIRLKTKSNSGIGFTDTKRLNQEFQQYSRSRHYFAFVVRTNSFKEFSQLRKTCIKNGFEYRLIPTDGIVKSSSNVNAKTQ